MTAIKPAQGNAYLAKPDPDCRLFLFFGSDEGLISERSRILAETLAARQHPPGELIRLDDADLETDPDRLGVELLTIPMFGGPKVIRVAAGRRMNAALLKPLVEGPTLPSMLIVEAGNLRPDEGLRALFERSKNAAAIGCYADEAANLDHLISEVVSAARLEITLEARQELVKRLGADRALSRGEIEKLVLFAADVAMIEVEHVEAIVGDASELTLDKIISATALGDPSSALRMYDRAVTAGEHAQGILIAMQRHFHRLHRARVALEQGKSLDDVIRQMRPPLHFKQRTAFERQCRRWTTPGLSGALSEISRVAEKARLTSSLDEALVGQLICDIAAVPVAGTSLSAKG